MPYNWTEYSGNDNTPALPLLISERTQQLLLAVIQDIMPRYKWLAVDDATWDDIDEQIADTITEILEEYVPVADNVPVGVITAFIGNAAAIPAKWLPCNYSLYAQADYPELVAILPSGYTTGSNFRTPNLQGHYIRGLADDTGRGGEAGSNQHTLTIAELPVHRHIVPAHAHAVPARANAGSTSNVAALAGAATNAVINTDTEPATDTSDVGSGDFFSIEPLHIRFYYIIKALP
jgi:microcystin-dependent protein